MKGLTLTMEIVIIAIVLLVTALVIMTIFGGSIASFLGILNPWSENMMEQNLCNQRCAAWCQGHLGTGGVQWGSEDMKVQTQSGEKSCAVIMTGLGSQCTCTTIISGTRCSLTCSSTQASTSIEGAEGTSGCAAGKKCRVACPAGTNGGTYPGTCVNV